MFVVLFAVVSMRLHNAGASAILLKSESYFELSLKAKLKYKKILFRTLRELQLPITLAV